MRNIIVFLFICGQLFSGSSVCSAAAPAPVHATGTFEFAGTEVGQTYPFAKVHADIVGRNLSEKSLQIERIVPRDPSGVLIRFTPSLVKAGESFSAGLDLTLNETLGRFAHYFDIYARGETEPVDGFVVRGFADWLVSPSGTDIDFGTFDVSKAVTRVIPIEVRPGVSVRLVGIEKPSAYFNAQVVQDGKALQLASREDAPWSSFDENLLVKTDSSLQPLVAFRLRGQARGKVVPSLDPLDFGLLREGQSAELIVVLNDVSGKPLEVGEVTAKSRMKVETSVTDCLPVNPSCKNLKVRYPPMNMLGTTGGVLEIELPDYKHDLYVRFGAIGIGKNTQIRSLADDFKAAQEDQKSISSVLRSSVAKAPVTKAVPATMSTPEGTGPLLKWQVTNEYDIYGYEIYRSDAESGPYERVSEKIIERLEGDPEAGSIYQWRDNSAKAGQTYWYYIDIVYNRGRKQQFTSPQKVVAK
ncbi:MAG: hypothetical protein KF811_02600 [Dokdonella sp.]|nr:hypothetical protein [Dokdonella sp.]